MKGKFWKGILVLMIVIFLIGTQIACKTDRTDRTGSRSNLEEKRWELLEQNSWLKLLENQQTDKNDIWISYYGVDDSKPLKELVIIARTNNNPVDEILQWYSIYGRGDKVLEIIGPISGSPGTEVKISVPDMKSNIPLSKEAMWRLVKTGIVYYFMVRQHFGVDTYEGLKRVIEKEKRN